MGKAKKEVVEPVTYKGNTKKGEKKDISGEFPSAYSPLYVEAAWYDWWEKEGFFKPEYNRDLSQKNPKGNFTIVIPPPNITGTLHLGHAMATTLEDTLIRWNRMKGKTVLFNPGCDHAGIATQVVVEKKLQRERKLTRHDLGREKFIEEVWKWKEEKGITIYDQLRKLGASVDWDRAVFMMDPKMEYAVNEAFVRLHERGVIYRNTRLVNWCCTLRSAISDIEVDKRELTGRTKLTVPGYERVVEFGVITEFSYKLDDGTKITVATTRLETMLGDVAIAVHPDDERYTSFIGKKCRHPFVDRELVIVADKMVQRDFGTGAVKITPAHDANDYEVGKRHNLPFINIFTDDGKINESGGEFAGLRRFDARYQLTEKLKALDLLGETRDNPMVVPICSRSGDIIEPIIKPQWFIKTETMCKRAMEAADSKALTIHPSNWHNDWNRWLEDGRDWCISRQLWWGFRIPVYFAAISDSPNDGSDEARWISAHNEVEALEKAAKRLNVDKSKITLHRDEDVLDTWFSAALWPFALFGWPHETPDLKNFYPNQLMETGHDIIFFWVAKMVFMAQELTGKLPFSDIVLHAMIRDAQGRKMSKSLGNIIDPLHVIYGITLQELHTQLEHGNLDPKEFEMAKKGQRKDFPNGIPECGVDALRFALLNYTSHGRNVNLDVMRVHGYRRFCNKIWQGMRFTFLQLGDDYQPEDKFKPNGSESPIDKWILSRLAYCIDRVDSTMAAFSFEAATTAVYNFWIYEFCDVYLEAVKPVMLEGDEKAALAVKNLLYLCVDNVLRLLAPIMPFVTEELWQRLPKRASEQAPSLHVANYPNVNDFSEYRDEKLDTDTATTLEIIGQIRSRRAARKYIPKARINVQLQCTEEDLRQQLDAYKGVITTLVNAAALDIAEKLTIDGELETITDSCSVLIALTES